MGSHNANMALGKNIRNARERMGLSTHDLAGLTEIAQSNISRYESGKTRPRFSQLERIAGALRTSTMILEYGDQNLLTMTVGRHTVPLIEWTNVAEFLDSLAKGLPLTYIELLPTDKQYSKNVFALRIADDSMSPGFNPGDAIIIDPETEPRPNDFVVAAYAGVSYFRQYKERGRANGKTEFELVALNDGYASLRSELGDITILGTWMERREYRKS